MRRRVPLAAAGTVSAGVECTVVGTAGCKVAAVEGTAEMRQRITAAVLETVVVVDGEVGSWIPIPTPDSDFTIPSCLGDSTPS